MRSSIASVVVFGLAAASATAQTIPGVIANTLFQVSEDDGAAESATKLTNPTPAGEAYNVDFNADAAGMTVLGISVELYVATYGPPRVGQIALCGDNLSLDASGRTPDLARPLASLTNPTSTNSFGSFCNNFVTYDTPDVTLGTGGVHGVLSFPTGDSTTYLCTDLWNTSGVPHTGARHSFFTTDSYSTPATFSYNKSNYMIRLACPPATPNGGLFLVNGLTSGTMPGLGTVALQFWSADTAAPTLYLQVLNVGSLIPLPSSVLSTGFTNFVPNAMQPLGMLSGTMPCSATGLTLSFGCFFSDNLDKKKNGQNRIKLSNFASTTVTATKICWPNTCFGIRDDGHIDGAFSPAVFNPRIWYGFGSAAKTNDCASVHMGKVSTLPPAVTNLTAVEAVTWDFCGTNPCWQQVGIYPSNTVLDPTGNTPDLSSPLTSISGSSVCSPGAGGGWGFPAVVYDTPDILANTTTDYHATFEYANGDSCLFIGLDMNGADDDYRYDCTPNLYLGGVSASSSFYSLDGFATPAVDSTSGGAYPVFNLMQRIDWN